jgi:hypothetical protein
MVLRRARGRPEPQKRTDRYAASFARSLRMTRRISSSTGGSTITYQLSLRIEYVKASVFVATSHTYLSGVQMEYPE